MASVSVRDLTVRFGAESILESLNLDIKAGEFLVLLGASGCGKSTLLNCIAGLVDFEDGQIFINEQNVTWSEPKDRGVGMVFQSFALYPSMTVEKNLSFSLRNARLSKSDINARVRRASKILRIEKLLLRKPSQLSGGQRQRVAIGRALVRDVNVFLLDEPLSNLDAKLRAELRVELNRLHKRLEKTTMVYVTHDQIEAMTLADRIAVMRDGIIQQLDSPITVYNVPVNRYVAEFIGSPSINMIGGVIDNQANQLTFQTRGITVDLSRYVFSHKVRTTSVTLGVRPEHIHVGESRVPGVFNCRIFVDLVEPMGSDTLIWATVFGNTLRVRLNGQSDVQPGDALSVYFDPANTSLFANDTNLRL